MPDGVHHTDSSLIHASKAASVVVESAAAQPQEDSALPRSNLPFLHPYRAAPATGTAGAAAGETVDHFQDKDTTRSCSSRRGRNNNNNSSVLNNNGESMKCLSAIEYNMKANERYFLLNKNTFQEIFDATLHEMTGAAAPVSRRADVRLQPVEGYDTESISLRSGSTHKDWTPECGGVYATESSGKKTEDVNGGAKKSDLFFCQTTQQDCEPTAQHKISASSGMPRTETGGVERGAQGIFTNRMTALNDITNDRHHSSLATNRSIPTATQSTAPNNFLPPMSPLDIESENEPLDLSVCRRDSKSSSADGRSQSSSEESSAPGSPINLTYSDNHPRTGEVQNNFTATTASEGNDKKSLSDSDEDEEIDLTSIEVVSTSSAGGVGNGDGSTYSSVSATEASVVCKHSASDERAAGRPDCCWQPTSNAPNEPSCHHRPRGATGATTNTEQARSIGDEIPVDPTTASCSVDTTREQDSGGSRKRKDSHSVMTGTTGRMATPRMKPRATENWRALSKSTVYDLVEGLVLKMDEEENSEASRSPPPPNKVKKSDNTEGDKDNSVSDNVNSRPVSRQQMNASPSSSEESTTSSSHEKSAGRPRYNNTNSTSTANSVMQSYDQSLSPASQLSTSQQSPKSVPAPNLSQLVKPGAKPEEGNPRTPAEDVGASPLDSQTNRHSPEHVKQCWVALNKMVVFDIVDTAIRSETKENNNNITVGGHGESRSTTPDSVSSRNTSRSTDDVGSISRKAAVSGCDSQDSSNKSRKRKCDSSSSPKAPTLSSGKYVEQTSKDSPLNFERVSMNESCAVPKRPRSSDCASGDINTDIVPIKQRRKSAEINRSYSAETYFDGNRQTDNHFAAKSFTKESNDHARRQGKAEGRSIAVGKEWESNLASRQSHGRMSPYYRSVTAGQSIAGRGGQRSDGTGDQKTSKSSRSTPSPTDSSNNIRNKRKSPTSLSSQHSGGLPVHDLSTNNVSSITHLVQSQRTTIDYGRNEILAAKQASIKLGLHSTTSQAHQAPAAIRSRCGVSVNNQYALDDTRDNNGDREIRRKRTKVDSSSTTNNNNEPITSIYSGLDGSRAVSLFSANERSDLIKDARSSPRLGWIAVSKVDVHNLFNSVVDSMMAADAEEESASQSRQDGKSADKTRSGSPSALPAPSSGRSGSPSVCSTSSLGTNSAGSSPQRQQVGCESGSNRPENESTGPYSPPSPSGKAGCIRTQSPSSYSDNLDSEHMIVDPGSPGDLYLDGEGKDSKSSKNKTFKWKSSLLMRVHEESQTTPLKQLGSSRSSSNSPSSESSSEPSEKGLGHSSSTTNITEEAGGQGQGHHNTSSMSSRRSGKKGSSHSHARAK